MKNHWKIMFVLFNLLRQVWLASLSPPFSYFCILVFCFCVCRLVLEADSAILVFWQATITERANAFRHQCELAETMKLKEINLYVLVTPFLVLVTLFYLWFQWYHVEWSQTLLETEPCLFSRFLLIYSDNSLFVMT